MNILMTERVVVLSVASKLMNLKLGTSKQPLKTGI